MLAIIRHRIFFVFQFAIQKYKDQDAQNRNYAFCFVWVWNSVAHTEEETQAEGGSRIGCWWRYLGL